MSPSRLIAPIALAAAVSLAACSPDAAQETPGAGPVSASAAEAALAAFGLSEQGRVTWEARAQEGDSFTFDAVTIADGDGALTAARLVMSGPQITEDGPVFARFELSDAEIVDSTGLRTGFERLLIVDAGPEVAEAVAAALQGRDALLDGADPAAGRFGEMTLEALTVSGMSETGQPLEFSIALASARNGDGDRIEEVRLDTLRFQTTDDQGAPVRVALDSLNGQGIAPALAGLSRTGASVPPSAPLAGALTPTGQYERFSMAGLVVTAAGMRVDMPALSGEVEATGADRLVSRTVMERLSLGADPEGGAQGAQFAQALNQLGYDTLEFSLENAVVYDLAADRVQTIDENYLRLEEGFTLRFEQAAQGVSAYAERYAAWLETDAGQVGETPPADVFEPLKIERMVFALEDQSLLDRSLGMLAAMQGVSPEQLRVQAGAYVALGAAFAGDMVPAPLLSELQTALTGFIGQGGILTVSLEPEEPVSVGAFMGTGGAPDTAALGLSVRHDAP